MRSGKYRPMFRFFFWLFVAVCIGLGYLGAQEPTDATNWISRLFSLYYFGFFLAILPALGLFEKTLPMPKTIADAVLAKNSPAKNAVAA